MLTVGKTRLLNYDSVTVTAQCSSFHYVICTVIITVRAMETGHKLIILHVADVCLYL